MILPAIFLALLSCSAGAQIDSLEAVDALSRALLIHRFPTLATTNASEEGFAAILRHLQDAKNLHLQDAKNATAGEFLNCAALPPGLCNGGELFECLSASEMLGLVPGASLSGAVARLCPLLLLQPTSCSAHSLPPTANPHTGRPSSLAVWGYGLLFVTLISGCSLVGVLLLPLLSRPFYSAVLTLFEGLAVGSLVGSSLFHLIPQTFRLVGQDKEHNYLWRSLLIFGGIYLFYVSERFMKVIIDIRKQRKLKRKLKYEVNDNSTEFLKSEPPPTLQNGGNYMNGGALQILTTDTLGSNYKLVNGNDTKMVQPFTVDTEVPHHHEHHFEGGESAVATVAWMIIFGDGLHNFIDGLSIGAAFSESVLAGISISMAVICEEFPHELGDFAVLLGAGMSMRQALLYNFLSACTCYGGLVVGVLLGDVAQGAPYIFALAAGMFLYIALVDMMGELSSALEDARKQGTKKQLQVFLVQNIGILLGVASLFLMARYQESFNFEGMDPSPGEDHLLRQSYSGMQEAKSTRL